ncbi:MAG: hypothetical protein J6T16_05615 [Opitutales bacterium]|nr:hypothetical protein [Opitutales bacterium]
MDSPEENDPFVVAVKTIALQEDSKFFLDWLLQARINALMELAEAKPQESQRAAGAAQAYGDILASVAHAMAIAKIQNPLGAVLEGGAKFEVFAKPKQSLFGKIKRFFRRR